MIYTDGIHLIASESLEELHAFALRIGLKRQWLHHSPRYPHYDLLSEESVRRALEAGALLRTSRQLVEILREAPYTPKRNKNPDAHDRGGHQLE